MREVVVPRDERWLAALVGIWHVTTQERDVSLITERLATRARWVGGGAFLHGDEVGCCHYRSADPTQVQQLGTVDHRVELGIEDYLHGLTRGVPEVDAVGERSSVPHPRFSERSDDTVPFHGRPNGDVSVDRGTGHTGPD